MIWFACKQCGRKHRKPDEAAGSLVFCECGQGNRVPWESTVPEPERPPEPEQPAVPPAPGRRRFAEPEEEDREEPRPRRRYWREARQRDPAYCLNHEDRSSEQTCADCGESFCARCVVVVRGKTLCGPCKNLRIVRLGRPPRLATMAIVSLMLGILSAPIAFCLTIVPLGLTQGPSVVCVAMSLTGAILLAGIVVLGVMAVREIEGSPRLGGRGSAMTGATTAAVGSIWCLAFAATIAGRLLLD